MIGEASLRFHRRRHGITWPVEHTEHLVSAQLDLATTARERFGQKGPMNVDQTGKLALPNPLR